MTESQYNELLKDILQKYNKKKPNIPARMVETSIDAILEVYAKAYKQLFSELYEKLMSDFGVLSDASYQSQLALLQMIEKRLDELNLVITSEIKEELEKHYASAGIFSALANETVKTIEELQGIVPYSDLDFYKMEQIVQDTMEDLLFVTQHTKKELKKYVREVFRKNIQYHGLTGENYNNIKKLIEKELSAQFIKEELKKKGFVGIVDAGGKKWNLKTYIDMAVSTKMNQAYEEGLKDKAYITGNDLAVIPEKSAVDSCSRFEGMIISMTGATEGFMTYDQLKATGLIFHPRCVHSPFPIGNIDLFPEEDFQFHLKKMNELKKFAKKKK